MQPLSVEESRLVRSCLGSRDPFDRVWCNGTDVAAASDQLFCVLDGAGSWRGGVLGDPLTDFIRLAAGEAKFDPQESGVRLSRGSVTLTLPAAPEKDFPWPRVGAPKGDIDLKAQDIELMAAAVAANGESGLQVTRFEMLGFAIASGVGYSLSLEALIKSKHAFDPKLSLLLPSAFLSVLRTAADYYKQERVVVFYNDRMVWTRVGRALLGAAVPAIASWLDVNRVSAPLQGVVPVDVDLSYLQKDLTLLQSLAATITLSKAGVRCGAAHAWYEASESVNLPEDCALSTARLAAVLPLTPKLTRVAARVVELEGEHFTVYLATAGL